jgi:hypothetical protein
LGSGPDYDRISPERGQTPYRPTSWAVSNAITVN